MNSRRLLIVLLLFAAAGCVCGVRAVLLAGPRRTEILNRADRIASKIRFIPGRRGKICDRNGTVLVWSELYFDLCMREDPPGTLNEDEEVMLKKLLPDIQLENPSKVLKSHLKPKELETLAPLLGTSVPLEIRRRYERLIIRSDAVRRLAGKTELHDGILCGTSGWELKYELQLRGVPGRYSIMFDRYQHFIPGTFKLLSPPAAGKDICLPETLEEIENSSKERRL